jgi:long-chain acyl-CoA synthetase
MDPLKKMTLKHMFERSLSEYAGRPALSMVDGESLTYAEVGERVRMLSGILHQRGIASGDRVAILSENKPNWGIAYFAVTTMGAVAVPILPEFRANEVHHILRHSGAKAVFISEKQYSKLEDAGIDGPLSVFLMEDFSIVPPQAEERAFQELLQAGRREFARLKESALRLANRAPGEIGEDDTASIIYTSGTTGHSKGVVLTHRNLVFDVEATLKIQPVKSDDRMLSVLPLSHSYECTIGFLIPMSVGACVYYLDKPPVAKVLMPALLKVRPTLMLTVPLIMEKIFKLRIHPRLTRNALMRKAYGIPAIRKKLHRISAGKVYKLFGGKLHFFGIGGALLSPDVELFLREGGFPYAIGYGLTETSPLAAGCGPPVTRYRSTGPALPGVEIRIDRPDPSTGEGEIQIKGPTVMKGYYADPERTKEVMTDDGWFRTGDLGSLDGDGYLYIKGRLKNMILGPSGENIYPEEIESVINESDEVMESLVYQSDGQLTARVHLNYDELDREFGGRNTGEGQLAARVREKLEALRQKVNARVASFSRIKRFIEQSEPFEKTPTNKIKRFLYVNDDKAVSDGADKRT